MDSKARKIFHKFPDEVKDYFKQVDEKCKTHGITFKISSGGSVNFGGCRSGGYFCEKSKTLAIASNVRLKWVLGALLHEESHLDQWADSNSVWYESKMDYSFLMFFGWLGGYFNIKNPETYAKKIIKLEADCEKRTIKKIKDRWQKYISVDDYARSANAYLFSYLWMAKSKKWVGDFTVYKKYTKHFPAKIHSKYEKLPIKFLKLFELAQNKKPSPRRERV